MILDYLFAVMLLIVGVLGGKRARKKKTPETTVGFVLLTLIAIPSVLLLVFFIDGLLDTDEEMVREIFEGSLYVAGLLNLVFPVLLGCSWIVGYAVGRSGSKGRQ